MRSYLVFGVCIIVLSTGCCAADLSRLLAYPWYELECNECSCLPDDQPERCIDYGKVQCPWSCEEDCDQHRCCCTPPPCSSGDCSCLSDDCKYNGFEYCKSPNKCLDYCYAGSYDERRCCCQRDIPPCKTGRCACLADSQPGPCEEYDFEYCNDPDHTKCCDPETGICCEEHRCCCDPNYETTSTTTTSPSTSTSTSTTTQVPPTSPPTESSTSTFTESTSISTRSSTSISTTQNPGLPGTNCTLNCTHEYECNTEDCFGIEEGQCEEHGYYKCCHSERCSAQNPPCDPEQCCCKREQCGCDESDSSLCWDRPCHWDNLNYYPFVDPICERDRRFTCCKPPPP